MYNVCIEIVYYLPRIESEFLPDVYKFAELAEGEWSKMYPVLLPHSSPCQVRCFSFGMQEVL